MSALQEALDEYLAARLAASATTLLTPQELR